MISLILLQMLGITKRDLQRWHLSPWDTRFPKQESFIPLEGKLANLDNHIEVQSQLV